MEQDQDTGETYVSPSLADILNPSTREEAPTVAEAGQPEAPPAPVAEEKGETNPEPKDDRPRDEAGRFAPKAREEDAAPPAAESEPRHVPVAALKDERAKRQAAEAQMQRMQAYIEQMQRQGQQPAPSQPAEAAPDPIGALLDNPQEFVARQVQQAVTPLAEQVIQQRIALSREFVAAQAPDYAEAEQALAEFVQANPQVAPQIGAQLRNHPNPAKWALEQGRALIRQRQWQPVMTQFPDPDAFVAARAPQPAAPPAPSAPHQSLPASLATARATGTRTAGEYRSPSLSELVRFKG